MPVLLLKSVRLFADPAKSVFAVSDPVRAGWQAAPACLPSAVSAAAFPPSLLLPAVPAYPDAFCLPAPCASAVRIVQKFAANMLLLLLDSPQNFPQAQTGGYSAQAACFFLPACRKLPRHPGFFAATARCVFSVLLRLPQAADPALPCGPFAPVRFLLLLSALFLCSATAGVFPKAGLRATCFLLFHLPCVQLPSPQINPRQAHLPNAAARQDVLPNVLPVRSGVLLWHAGGQAVFFPGPALLFQARCPALLQAADDDCNRRPGKGCLLSGRLPKALPGHPKRAAPFCGSGLLPAPFPLRHCYTLSVPTQALPAAVLTAFAALSDFHVLSFVRQVLFAAV